MAQSLIPTSAIAPAPAQQPGAQPGANPSANPAATSSGAGAGGQPAYAWILAWGVMLVILTLINRSRFGHTVIYYTLCLMLFFILVSNYRMITAALAPFNTLPAKG